LSLEEDKLASLRGVLIKDIVLEFVQGVNDLEEVALAKEEFEVLHSCLLYDLNISLLRFCFVLREESFIYR
jgi:hypothetical protein